MPSNPADDVLRSGSQFRLVGVVAVLRNFTMNEI
jgi:hypothetical protein